MAGQRPGSGGRQQIPLKNQFQGAGFLFSSFESKANRSPSAWGGMTQPPNGAKLSSLGNSAGKHTHTWKKPPFLTFSASILKTDYFTHPLSAFSMASRSTEPPRNSCFQLKAFPIRTQRDSDVFNTETLSWGHSCFPQGPTPEPNQQNPDQTQEVMDASHGSRTQQ